MRTPSAPWNPKGEFEKARRAHRCPRGRSSRTPGSFSCKLGASGGARRGHDAVDGPLWPSRPWGSAIELSGWRGQYLSRMPKADERIMDANAWVVPTGSLPLVRAGGHAGYGPPRELKALYRVLCHPLTNSRFAAPRICSTLVDEA